MADFKQVNDWHSSGGCMTTLELLQERRRAAMERHRRDFDEERRRDIRDYDEVDGPSQHEGDIGA